MSYVYTKLAEKVGYFDTLLKLFKLSALFSGRHNSLIEGFNEKRNKHKVSGLEGLKLVHNILETRGNVYLASLRIVTYKINRRSKGMVRRKNTHSALCNIEVIHALLHIHTDILGGQHNALTLTGSSGCKYYRSKLFRIDLIIIV